MDIKAVERKLNRDKKHPWIELMCTEFAKLGFSVTINGKRIDQNGFCNDSYHKLYNTNRLPLRIVLQTRKTKSIRIKVGIGTKNKCLLTKVRS